MSRTFRIGIVAPSSKIPRIELEYGVQRIQEEGFDVDVHPQCLKSHLFFAGNDEERANAFYDFARDENYLALWCARGGHGAIRLLPLLEELTRQKGVPSPKLLIGYSDITALAEFVHHRWGWTFLHAPMPSMRKFPYLPESDWQAMNYWIRGQEASLPWKNKKLQFWTSAPTSSLVAPLVGGNLTVWNCLLGTPFQGKAEDCILFLEDVDEALYRIDRMMQQLLNSKSLTQIKAIVLGNFMNCKDYSPSVLKKRPSQRAKKRTLLQPKPSELQPLRKCVSELKGLREIFTEVGNKLGIPVAYGLPVGHGPEVSPLPLYATYQLSSDGSFRLVKWDWIQSA